MEEGTNRDLTSGERAHLLRTPLSRSRASSRARSDTKLWKKYFFTIPTFLFFLTSFQLVNLLTLTYTDSVLNYIAKRFRIPYTMASFIPSSYMIGSMLAVVPVSYFGVNWNKPKAISIGVMVMIFGMGLCILPHFIMSQYNVNNSTVTYLCKRRSNDSIFQTHHKFSTSPRSIHEDIPDQIMLQDNYKLTRKKHDTWHAFVNHYHSPDKVITASLSAPKELPCNKNSTTYNPSVLLILGHVLIGGGASPLWPLGVAYLDDHVLSRKMPLYLGVFIGTVLTGPVAGFLLGSVSSAIYVTMDKHRLTPKDPRWIGAWWLGYVFSAGLLLLMLVPFCFFPESLPISDEKKSEKLKILLEKQKREEHEEEDGLNDVFSDEDGATSSVHSEASSFLEKHIPASLYLATKDIFSRPVAVCCILAYSALANLLAGVSTFGSTYIQMEFNVLRITSDMLIGGVCVPLAIISTFGGGFVLKKFDFNIKQIVTFTVVMSGIGVLFFICLYPIGCSLPITAGINYPTTRNTIRPALNQTCNRGCNCTTSMVKLICGDDKITYMTPCYAGCTAETTHINGLKMTYAYHNCSCIKSSKQNAKLGPCLVKNCSKLLVLFMFVCSIGVSALCFCQAPAYSALLRSLADANKPYGIGIMTIISRLLGFIPAPIWFGHLIDRSCIYWGPKCKGKALCKLYNNSGLRFHFVTACVMCGACYTFIFMLTYCWIVWKRNTTISPDDKSHNK